MRLAAPFAFVAALAAAAVTLFAGAGPSLAQPPAQTCEGRNLFDSMAAADHADLRARADAVPFARGNLWVARRGGQILHIAGTYHLDDPRHDATFAVLEPLIGSARTVLVEAGPEEEKALLERVASDPGVMMITEGPTLIDLMPPDEWQQLSEALRERNIPPFMAAKFRPWYLSAVLAIPPCQTGAAEPSRGLDGRVIRAAQDAAVPIRALEPYDTVFGLFDRLTQEEQLDMIRATLATEDQSVDLAVTLADSYFAGDSRIVWELMHKMALQMPGTTPEQVEDEFARMEELLMNGRNRAWIPVIEKAAASGPAVVAFGALHLSGDEGVLNLLAQNGWALEPLQP